MAAAGGGNSLPSPSCADDRKRRVCYYYDPAIAGVDYGPNHFMVPRRVAMTHSLVAAYGMLGDMRRLRTRPATEAELLRFHAAEYVGVLRDLEDRGAGGVGESARRKARGFGIGGMPSRRGCDDDSPAFQGLWDYCLCYSGGSLAAARALVAGGSDIAINWSGGMHHACEAMASGFCYINDIVLAINELVGCFSRVIYVDIDAHHGDGVEEAFAESDRVMTLSFHRYGGGFFPMTGSVDQVGRGAGKHYSLNVPLDASVGDDGYLAVFRPIVRKAIEKFQPEAIVLQCGTDSLSGDRLGGMELTVRGHAECVSFIRSFNLPLLLLGGGGYTINHVASAWCYETAVAVGKEKEISDEIPFHYYSKYYDPQDNKLHFPASPAATSNAAAQETMRRVLMHINELNSAPSVQFKERRDSFAGGDDDAGDEDLYYERPPSLEDDEPMQRLHRLCDEADAKEFIIEQGKRHELNHGSSSAGGNRRRRPDSPEHGTKRRSLGGGSTTRGRESLGGLFASQT